ncbi:MAG TPA: SGNH/GDSL hydrolase family protein [Candidatus Dormibacteraeota bacterium]|nr:SGNH/GDSL hydrolase family protein [Candidatus Dormibacteraeota bacterium]
MAGGTPANPATRVGKSEAVHYLALGDSYTIGTGASSHAHNYPSILADRVSKATGRKVGLTNPAVNGFTTLDLIANELGYLSRLKPQVVSVLIGVNDLVHGRTPEQYRGSLVQIYDAVAALRLPAGRVVAISIPNWSVVPAARSFGDPTRIRRLTETFNTIAQQEAEAREFTWIDITVTSTSASVSPGWISSDQLHPGDAQYAAWAEVIWNTIRESWIAAVAKP